MYERTLNLSANSYLSNQFDVHSMYGYFEAKGAYTYIVVFTFIFFVSFNVIDELVPPLSVIEAVYVDGISKLCIFELFLDSNPRGSC